MRGEDALTSQSQAMARCECSLFLTTQRPLLGESSDGLGSIRSLVPNRLQSANLGHSGSQVEFPDPRRQQAACGQSQLLLQSVSTKAGDFRQFGCGE